MTPSETPASPERTSGAKAASAPRPPFRLGREDGLIFVLAMMQFTHIMDFMIMMPLGPRFMEVFGISPTAFGLLVSSYTFSAAASGFIGAFLLDRFDRRAALLFLYTGFALGTLACGLAPGFAVLLLARILAGFFGGMLGAQILAIVGEQIPEERRGKAMGRIFASFSFASVIGVPAGLWLANRGGWHAPFFFLAALCLLFFAAAWKLLPRMRDHLAGPDRGPALRSLYEVVVHPVHLRAFAFITALMLGGFSVIPFLSPYMVANVGFTNEDLSYIYFFGGAMTLITSPWIGRLSDRFGKPRVFTVVALLSLLPILAVTHLGPLPLPAAIAVTTVFMVLVSGRMVPAMALVTSSADPRRRGSFMSVNSSVQQMASGLASFLAGSLLATAADGRMLHYDRVGYLAVAASLLALVLARGMKGFQTPS